LIFVWQYQPSWIAISLNAHNQSLADSTQFFVATNNKTTIVKFVDVSKFFISAIVVSTKEVVGGLGKEVDVWKKIQTEYKCKKIFGLN